MRGWCSSGSGCSKLRVVLSNPAPSNAGIPTRVPPGGGAPLCFTLLVPGSLPLPLVSCLLLLLSCCRYVRGRCSCSADSALSCGVYGARRCRDGAVSVFCGACGAFRVLIVIVARVVLLLSWLLIGAGSVLTERLVRAAMPQRTLPASIAVQSSIINCYRNRQTCPNRGGPKSGEGASLQNGGQHDSSRGGLFARSVCSGAFCDRRSQDIVGISSACCIRASIIRMCARAAMVCNVVLSALLRRVVVCIRISLLAVIVHGVRVSDSDECACAMLSMRAQSIRRARGTAASIRARSAIAMDSTMLPVW